MNNTTTIHGFTFVKLGEAYLSDTPLKAVHKGKAFDWFVSLKPVDERLLDAEESTYAVYFDDELVYIGEYSTTFSERWLRNKKYLWHSDNIDNKVKEALHQHRLVTVWITKDPYVTGPCGREFNISKIIEHEILKASPPPFNKRNSGLRRSAKAVRVKDIV